MPWRDVKLMDIRRQFVAAFGSGLYSMAELCEQYAISRKTGYKWVCRHRQLGAAGLDNRSRARKAQPLKTPDDIRAILIDCRKRHRSWGPKKLIAALSQQRPELADRLPAASTAGDILKAEGLVSPRRKRNRSPHPGTSPLEADRPNQVWCIDFKGEFKLGDGTMCYPLTVTDACTRYLLLCERLPSTAGDGVMRALAELFERVGLPEALRSDNGAPFCSQAIGGISRLWLWWTKLGIRHDRIRPASPQENGRHERMHRTLKEQTARPPAADAASQQMSFDAFVREYNQVRPHEALGMSTPASLWYPSTRRLPHPLPVPVYAGHMSVRRVRPSGEIKFKGSLSFLSEVLTGESVGLEEVEEGIWSVYFFSHLLGRLDERTRKIVPASPKPETATRNP